MAAPISPLPARLLGILPCLLLACAAPESRTDGEWLRANHEQIRKDCRPIIDGLLAYHKDSGRYPMEADPAFEPHAQWLDSQGWNWIYYVEPDQSAFCLGIGDVDLDGASIVWCSRHHGWALDTKSEGLILLEESGLQSNQVNSRFAPDQP